MLSTQHSDMYAAPSQFVMLLHPHTLPHHHLHPSFPNTSCRPAATKPYPLQQPQPHKPSHRPHTPVSHPALMPYFSCPLFTQFSPCFLTHLIALTHNALSHSQFLVDRLAAILTRRASTSPLAAASGLVINTLGWVDGLGYELQLHAIHALKVGVM